MFGTHVIGAAHAARRTLPSLGLAAMLLTSTLGSPTLALAQEPIVHDSRMGGPPAVYVQVVVKGVYIYDDRDWGDGEMKLETGFSTARLPRGHAEMPGAPGRRLDTSDGASAPVRSTAYAFNNLVTQCQRGVWAVIPRHPPEP